MISWHQRLPMAKKFLLLGALALGVIVPLSALVIMGQSQAAATATRQLSGLTPAENVLKLVMLTQKHRGAAGGVLTGNEGMRAIREEAEKAASTGFEQTDAALSALNDAGVQRSLGALKTRWTALVDDVRAQRVDAVQNFTRHTELITLQLGLLTEVMDASALSLDADPVTYHLVMGVLEDMPRVTETLGQLRAKGTLALTRREMTPVAQAEMAALMRQGQSHFVDAGRHLAASATSSAAVDRLLATPRTTAAAQLQQMERLVQSVLQGHASGQMEAKAYFAETSRAIDAQFTLIDAALPHLRQVLEARAREEQQLAWGIAALVAGMVGVCGWLSWSIARSTTRSVDAAVRLARDVAGGDLSQRVHAEGDDELAQLLRTLDDMVQKLSGMVGSVREGSDTIATAAAQIASGNADLSTRTEHQAANLQETASSLEDVASSARHSAENARLAEQLANQATTVASQGGHAVHQVVDTMTDIQVASRKISDIIGVIDGIAFQTNILALNAAVEAARAGEHGRGFAVVAAEVRTLAQRSASAAREIKVLITDSVEKVELGHARVSEAGQTISGVVDHVRRVNDLIAEMSAASLAQESGMTQVNAAVSQIDQSTQQNAALVEQTAAAAGSLRQQALRLSETVGAFRLAERARAG
ncbi:methyl-accepting chemotaxis protein [Sphaerotilus hippei]|uniref:Methyl-accepting chemotaxis protein n=1 Tax=Sphaerotilus hippei TaxID=744406 RepID=A0A318GXU1_9BURK|nr:methyl-accepting chemotaxis protein [Sphaerotilus hippei]PXW94719.1 methyl-accepting chemotaxis protein [Sphaerotilus hippei]